MSTFSSDVPLASILKERLRRARKALGISQSAAAKIINVSQKQVSDYEQNGKAVPTEEMVLILETRLAEKRSALDSLTVASPSIGPRLVSDEIFQEHIRGFLTSWDKWRRRPEAADDRCQFFIFGAERLPAFSEQRARELWISNLKVQVDYHLFGVLDELGSDQIQDAVNTLKKIETGARAAFDNEGISAIHLHGIIAAPPEEPSDDGRLKAQRLYDGLVRSMSETTGSGIAVRELVHLQSKPNWLKAVRLSDSPLMVGRIRPKLEQVSTAFRDMPQSLISFAARRVRNVSLVPDGPQETGWLFLDRRTTNELIKYIDKIIS